MYLENIKSSTPSSNGSDRFAWRLIYEAKELLALGGSAVGESEHNVLHCLLSKAKGEVSCESTADELEQPEVG